jgi:hypothetical protein
MPGYGRKIRFSAECDAAAEKLGGYAKIDPALDAVYDGLARNPYGYERWESDWGSVRYVITNSFEDIPELVWWFVIEPDGGVIIENVEEHSPY